MRATREEKQRAWADFILKRGALYQNCNLDNFLCNASTKEDRTRQEVVRSQLKNLDLSEWPNVPSMCWFGGVGCGKDHLMAAMVVKLIDTCMVPYRRGPESRWRLPTIRWVNGPTMFGDVRDGMENKKSVEGRRNEKEFVGNFVSADLLCISDPSSTRDDLTNFQKEMLYRVIDGRYSRELPTWITMNARDQADLQGRLGPPVADRIIDDALVFFCKWESYRKSRDK